MNENWALVNDFLWLSLFIGIGVFFKRKVYFFRTAQAGQEILPVILVFHLKVREALYPALRQ